MDWTDLEGMWNELLANVKSQWPKLSDDDLENVAGKKEQLVRKLQTAAVRPERSRGPNPA